MLLPSASERCARRLLDTAPRVMRLIRREMRGAAEPNLSVPQFRTLAFLGFHRDASMTEVAEHLGITKATSSAMVERLVGRGLVERRDDPRERRRVMLALTPEGASLLESSRERTRAFLAERLGTLAEGELDLLAQGLELLAKALGLGEGRP